MLIAGVPVWLQIIGIIFGVIAGGATLYGLFVGARYLVKAARIRATNELADSAVASLTAANQALETRLTLVEKDNEHCREKSHQQDMVIGQLNARLEELRDWVTARDLITDLTNMTRAGLIALDVDPKVLEVASAGDPAKKP